MGYFYYLANGPGHPGRYTKTRGFLSYYEVHLTISYSRHIYIYLFLFDQICEQGQSQNWQRVWLESEKAWYMAGGDQWISYEDVDSAALKVKNFYSRNNHMYMFIYLGTICKS